MNGLAWTELYDRFAAFAYVARKQGFYVGQIQEMEYSLFGMCPFPKKTIGLTAERVARNEGY
ncbi:hypothetical protein ACTNDZ_00755 [Selenomonas montiformis]|uniref:hypothetical protein n=1 Tax=Selenomonas montiformis TaxID=2652285 RepID=UPI003F8BE080